MELEEKIGILLKEKTIKLAVAESTTGGLICSRIVSIPGSSAYFDRGAVVYSRKAKEEMLGVSPDLLDKFGAVSPQTAKAMAEGIKKTSGVELGLAETGIAGPILGRSAKPLGTAYIALATPSGNSYHEFHFSGSRQAICEAISQAALDILINYMSRGPKSDTDS